MCGLLFGVQKGPKNAFWSPDFACTPCDHRQARRRQHNGVKNFIIAHRVQKYFENSLASKKWIIVLKDQCNIQTTYINYCTLRFSHWILKPNYSKRQRSSSSFLLTLGNNSGPNWPGVLSRLVSSI